MVQIHSKLKIEGGYEHTLYWNNVIFSRFEHLSKGSSQISQHLGIVNSCEARFLEQVLSAKLDPFQIDSKFDTVCALQ